MCGRYVLAEDLAYVEYQLVHREVRFIDVIVYVVPFGLLVDQEADERHDVADVSHRLSVASAADHEEASARNLTQQIEDIAPVALAEDHGRAQDADVEVGMFRMPLLQHLLRLPFAFAVMVERIGRMRFVRILLVEAVNRHRGGEDEAPHTRGEHGFEYVFHAPDVHVVVERHGRHVVAVFGSQQHHDVRSCDFFAQRLRIAHVGQLRHVGEEVALPLVDVAQRVFFGLLAEQPQ